MLILILRSLKNRTELFLHEERCQNIFMDKTIKSELEKGSLTAGTNISYWTDSARPKPLPKASNDMVTDVVIIGAGMSGLSIAYQLLKEGKSVVVVEDGYIGSGETGRTSAHLTAVLDPRYFELEKLYGKDNAKLIAESHMQAIGTIENIIKNESIDCDFQRVSGILFLHPTDEPESLKKELEAATRAGLDVIYHESIPGINQNGPCLEFTSQAKFHPMKYLSGLTAAIISMGGKIFNNTHAEEIDENGITTRDGVRISAQHIVVATNTPVNNKYLMHLRQYPYRTYIVAACVPKNSVPDFLYWDTGDQSGAANDAYHYVRVQPYSDVHDLVICGGEDHPTGLIDSTEKPDEEQRYRDLESWLRQNFNVNEIMYQWSGQVMYPFDKLAYIGKNPMDKGNIYIVTGDCGNGLTYGAIAALLLSDLISDNKNEYEHIYRPSRFKLKAGKVFLEEFVSGFINYLKTKPRKSDDTIDDLAPGEAKIVSIDKKKYGVYRSYDHYIHVVEAECTHLGCIVKWNGDEQSWDCPCHGSRFTSTGEVINGPANVNLAYHKIPEAEFQDLKSNIHN